MRFVNVLQNKFAVLVAILALLTVLAIGALASGDCPWVDDNGFCVPDYGERPAPGASDPDDLLETLNGG